MGGFVAGGGQPALKDLLPEGSDVGDGVHREDGVVRAGDDHAADAGGEGGEVFHLVAGEVFEALVGHVHLAGGAVGDLGFRAQREREGVELVPLRRDGLEGRGEVVPAADSGEFELAMAVEGGG